MPDIFDEVDEDLRAERAQALFRRYRWAGAALIVLILAGTAVYVAWQDRQRAADEKAASLFLTATHTEPASTAPSDPKAAATLSDLAASGPAGYAVLARLRLADLDWQQGRKSEALAAWQAVAGDGAAPRTLRDLADLADIQHTLDSADPRTLENRLARLTLPECAWRPLAMQTLALLQIREGKTKEAADTLRQIQTDVTAPENARQMASTLLQAIAAPPQPPAAGTHG